MFTLNLLIQQSLQAEFIKTSNYRKCENTIFSTVKHKLLRPAVNRTVGCHFWKCLSNQFRHQQHEPVRLRPCRNHTPTALSWPSAFLGCYPQLPSRSVLGMTSSAGRYKTKKRINICVTMDSGSAAECLWFWADLRQIIIMANTSPSL